MKLFIKSKMKRIRLVVLSICMVTISCASISTRASMDYLKRYDIYINNEYFIFEERLTSEFLPFLGEKELYSFDSVTAEVANAINSSLFPLTNKLPGQIIALNFNFTELSTGLKKIVRINNEKSICNDEEDRYGFTEIIPDPKKIFIDLSGDSYTLTIGFYEAKTLIQIASYTIQKDIDREAKDAQIKDEFIKNNGLITSIDGNSKICIPISTNLELVIKTNKYLFDMVEQQIVNRPILVQFKCDRDKFDLFVRWWLHEYYQYIDTTMSEVYFLDRTENQDYVIIASLYPPGLNLYFMTYEYFAATH